MPRVYELYYVMEQNLFTTQNAFESETQNYLRQLEKYEMRVNSFSCPSKH